MIAAAIGWVLVLLGVLSLRDHSGWAFEAGGSPRAWRGLRVRGLLFLTGVLLIGGGFSWARGLHRTPHWLTWALLLLGIAAMVVFAAYRPKAAIDVPRSAVARKHAAAPMRLERRSAAVWAALFAVALAAAVAVVVLAAAHRPIRALESRARKSNPRHGIGVEGCRASMDGPGRIGAPAVSVDCPREVGGISPSNSSAAEGGRAT